MSIQLKTPIIIPAVPEKILDRVWLRSVFLSSPTVQKDPDAIPKDATIDFTLIPYSESLEVDASKTIVLKVSDIYTRVEAGDAELALILELLAKYAENEMIKQSEE